ncbi:MAG: hypothetical protein CL846_10540 [Crocinitomicaceae bacterium]|nr:hypothetical protein [Crocinitomicaceae bacterium]
MFKLLIHKAVNYIGLMFLSFLIILNSCNSDFDLNAPYKSIPIVYGLLDQSLDTQFIKINRSYLGDSNNVESAAINDSTHFQNITASVQQFNINDTLNPVRIYPLEEIWVNNIDDGLFYEDSQKVYYFVPDPVSFSGFDTVYLNDENIYKLFLQVPGTDDLVSAKTELIDGSGLSYNQFYKLTLKTFGFNLLNDVDLGTSPEYNDHRVDWNTASKAKRYELMLKFHFDEVSTQGQVTKKSIDWDLGSQKSINSDGGEELNKKFNGLAFFELIDSKLSGYASESSVEKRIIDEVEFILTAGNEDLNIFMDVNEPATGVVTERPSFTNVNNGLGIFASKYQKSITGKLTNSTVLELCMGQITSGYKFCTDSSDQVTGISNLTGGVFVGCN